MRRFRRLPCISIFALPPFLASPEDTRGASPDRRLIERFTRTERDNYGMRYMRSASRHLERTQ